jgi:MFS family permease
VVAAAAPNYWIFVACFAVGRPFLSAALTLIQVVAVELSSARQRVRHLSIVAAGSGGGAGIASVLHGLIRHGQEFRVLFALALIPLATLWPLVRSLPETHRQIPPSKLGAIPRFDRSRLLKVGILMGSTGLISGPANGFLFVYGESLLKVPPRNLALIVATSALAGLLGLGLSRFVADRCGRRFTVWIGICGSSLAGVLAYFGGYDHFVYGFYVGVFAAGLLTPSLNALSVELFAPSIRATVGGWVVVATVIGATAGLVAFGALTGTGHVVPSEAMRHAALWTFLPAIALAGVVWLLPETHHHELDDISVRSA